MSLPVLPEPTAAPLPVLLDSLRDFVKLALDSDDLAELSARYDQAHAIADYLGRKDHAKEGQAALRILEVRIGELLGPARNGGDRVSEQFQPVETAIRPQYRTAFRQMAAAADTVYALIDELEVPTRKAILRAIKRTDHQTSHDAWEDTAQADPTATPERFAAIVIDPPWRYDNTVTRGAAEDHYPTMSMDELRALELPAADNSHIYLWVTNPFIREGFELLDAWGYQYKTTLTWCKPQIGMGNYFRSATEHVLFGIKGKLPTLANNIPTWFVADRTRHSAKPESFYDLVERASPGPYMEMFARRRRFNWHTWGNEA